VGGRGNWKGNWKGLLALLDEVAPAVCGTCEVPYRRGKPLS